MGVSAIHWLVTHRSCTHDMQLHLATLHFVKDRTAPSSCALSMFPKADSSFLQIPASSGDVILGVRQLALLLCAGQTGEQIKMNLAEWVSQAQHMKCSDGIAGPSGGGLAVDFSLEKLSAFGDLLQHCRGLVRLEATGNDLTSLAGSLSIHVLHLCMHCCS